jgi:hypothetical protein
MERIQQHVQQMPDVKAAVALVTTGAGGSFIQAITEWANVFVAIGNAALVAAGLYLMYHKIFNKRRNRRDGD